MIDGRRLRFSSWEGFATILTLGLDRIAMTTRIVNPEADFFGYLAQGRFMLQRCRASGRFFFYPRVAEPCSGSRDLEWVPAKGTGTVYSTTVVRNRRPEPDHNVALIDLSEGVRIMSRVIGIAPEDVRIGMCVRARILPDDGTGEQRALLVFEPQPQRPEQVADE